MALIVLTNNGVDQTNIDDARDYQFNAGNRDGIVKGAFNEGKFVATASNVISFDTCEMRISGHRVINNSAWTKTFTSLPSANERHALVLHLVVDDNSTVTASFIDRLVSVTPTQDKLYEHANGAGTYEVEIGRFTLTTAGLVEDVTRTIDIITGGKGSGDGAINIGNVTTNTLASGLEAEVDIEQRLNQEDGKTYTDFNFDIPKGDKGDKGEGVANVQLSLQSTDASGNKIYKATTTLSDSTTIDSGNITVPKGDKGEDVANVQFTLQSTDASGNKIYKATTTLSDSTTIDSGNITVPKGDKGDTGNTGATGATGASVTNVQVTYASTDANGNNIYNVTSTIGGNTVNSGTITAPKGDTGTFESLDDTLSTTSENAVQNKVVTAAINANSTNIANLQSSKADGYSLTLTHNVASTNGWKYLVAKFLTIDYSSYTNGKGACIKLKAKSFKSGSMYNYDDDARNFTIDEDIIIQKDGGSSTLVSIYRYDTIRYWWSFNNQLRDCTFGDIFWTDDTTNKVLTFYMFCGENSSTQFTPYTSMNATTPTGITQHTGNAEYYSSGTINWAQFGLGTRVALKSEVNHVEDRIPTSINGMSGGTVNGNITAQYLTGTWLKSTSATDIGTSGWNAVWVDDGTGWLYKRTRAHFTNDILNLVYPVGSIYLTVATSTTGSTSPASFLGGVWTRIGAGYALWTADSGAGTPISAGLPNITGSVDIRPCAGSSSALFNNPNAALNFIDNAGTHWQGGMSTSNTSNNLARLTFNAANSNSIYGSSSTVQPPAYKVYAWQRTE